MKLNFMKLLFILLSTLTLSVSCDQVKEKTRETINKSGEIVGETSTEFLHGVKKGVDNTLNCKLEIGENLKDAGIETGKFSINSKASSNNNLLTVYLIFNKNFNKEVTVKATDKSGVEIGRTKLKINEKSGYAGYYDFEFDTRTDIESKSILSVY